MSCKGREREIAEENVKDESDRSKEQEEKEERVRG